MVPEIPSHNDNAQNSEKEIIYDENANNVELGAPVDLDSEDEVKL